MSESAMTAAVPAPLEGVAPRIAAARAAWPAWRRLSLVQRVAALARCLDALQARAQPLARALCRELGKPITQAEEEVADALDEARHLLARAPAVLASGRLGDDGGAEHRRVWEPCGVVAVITPSNYPLELSLWGIVGALVSGNVVMFKPTEQALGVGSLIDAAFRAGDLPGDVFNTVLGLREHGQAIVEGDCDLIWFVGSTAAGRRILASTAGTLKKAILELGGSSPAVVFEDADPDGPQVRQLFASRFANAGQVCSAVKRLYVHESLHDRVVANARRFADELVVGPPEDPRTQLGPVVSAEERARLLDILQDARDAGAIVQPGKADVDALSGHFIAPTIVTGVHHGLRIMREEVFGPILPIMSFRDESEAVALMNDSDYGLSAFLVTPDSGRAERVASQVEAGRVFVNCMGGPGIKFDFEAYKSSGVGRHQGDSLLLGFVRMKYCKFKAITPPA